MEIFKPCMICKKKMAVTACQKCGILVCNDHTDKGFCHACSRERKSTHAEKVRNV